MLQFDLETITDALNLTIDGPKSSYSFTYNASFTSSTSMEIQLSFSTSLTGYGQENLTITFNKDNFKAETGVNLYNNTVYSTLYAQDSATAAVKKGGMAITSILGTTLGIMILANVFL